MTQLNGPLRVHPHNGRYFIDPAGRAVLLVGSHTWDNLQDIGVTNPPKAFDYEQYLAFLTDHGHNFFRLWCWEQVYWTCMWRGSYRTDPMIYVRTGPGTAADGKPKFDLQQLDPRHFDRMRHRVIAAGKRGIYVSIMLFDGWSVEPKAGDYDNPWPFHPFHRDNNINGVDGDPSRHADGRDTHGLRVPDITAVQERYIRHVIETVGDQPNVLYEISNESGGQSYDWQNHMVRFIHEVEATRALQHPVGITVPYPGGDNARLMASPADWISPKPASGGDAGDPEVADGRKVIIDDTDHLWGIGGDRKWAWKSFTRGRHPVFMDPYDSPGTWLGALKGYDFKDERWVSLRRNLGYVRRLADQVDLAAMTPRGNLSSTTYCLATSDHADWPTCIAYQPDAGPFTVDLTHVDGSLAVQWINPVDGSSVRAAADVRGGSKITLNPPFDHDGVVHLYRK